MSPLCKHCLLCFPKINVFPEQNYFRCTPFSMKLNLQDISSHIQQRTFLSKYPNKKSSDRQAFSIFHIEESLYLNYNEDSISPPNQVSCCIKPSIMLALNLSFCAPTETPQFWHPHLSTILSSSFISHSNVCTFLSRKKKNKTKKKKPFLWLPYPMEIALNRCYRDLSL